MAIIQHTCTGCVPIDASILEVYTQLIGAKDSANTAAERAEHAAEYAIGKSPYIGENGDWWEWDDELGQFVDTMVQAQGSIAVDTQMSDTSTNPVQNKVVKEYIDEHTGSDPDAVKYTQQTLSDSQKAQARTNIGAGTYSKPSGGIPASDLAAGVIPDVSGFVTKSVNDLLNYYLKSETYTKAEVQQLISAIQGFSYEVVASLPTASSDTMGKIYLAPSADPQTQNIKDEYITIDNGESAQTRYTWEQIGSTAIDLSGYVTTQQLNTALAAYTTTANLTTLLAGKQDIISDLASIRSGAAAGATAYQKPSTGIPASDIASGVIPTVPTISTDVSADAASDVKTSSPKSVKTYVDAGIAAVESDLSDLADEVEAIDIGAYVMAWDGNSEPVVANIPAGVSVTYNSTTYTGTLAASASTTQKIYLVATGTTDNYDRYITVGDSTYSWVNIGTTEITLADYATKTEVSQLEADVFGGEVTEDVTIDLSEQTRIAARITNNKWVTSGIGSTECMIIPIDGISTIRVVMTGAGNIAFLASNTIVANTTPYYSTSYPSMIELSSGNDVTYITAVDCHYLYILAKNSSGTDTSVRYTISGVKVYSSGGAINEINDRIDGIEAELGVGDKTISPEIEVGTITNSGLDNETEFYEEKYWRTARFIKLADISTITANVVTAGNNIRFAYYNANFTFISLNDVSAASTVTDTPPSGAVYLRVGIDSARPSSSAFNIPKPKFSLTGKFAEKWDTPMNRPSTGSLSILVPVLVSDPNTDATETANLQDTQTLLSDSGVLALPATYDPAGNPTRLIIYCHGAGVNYAIGTGTFPSSDLKPEYWLAEGYAVMDVEGNPYNDTDEHFFIPAARQSYIAAYEFVIRKYNIRKDGILLGGRSMGGGMTFDLLLSRIPVIAACPVVPAINEIWCWEYMNASRRQFVAQKMGFTGTAPTWTNNSPMSSAEWEYLQANFDKFIKYSPFFALMPDTPSKTEIFSVGNVGSSSNNSEETTLYGERHFKCKAPVKMFAVRDDSTVKNSRNCDLVYQMMLNSAQVVEMRYFLTGGHHFELTSPYLLASYTTQYGETLTNVPVVYVEMLAFWRRYEQGL